MAPELRSVSCGHLSEERYHRCTIAVLTEVKLPDPGPLREDCIQLGAGRGPIGASSLGEEIRGCLAENGPLLFIATTDHEAAPAMWITSARSIPAELLSTRA